LLQIYNGQYIFLQKLKEIAQKIFLLGDTKIVHTCSAHNN